MDTDRLKGLALLAIIAGWLVWKFELYNPLGALKDATRTTPPGAAEMPPNERAFLELIDGYATAYAAAPNDMAKGALRPQRADAISDFIEKHPDGPLWTGRVATLSSTSSGKGVLRLQIGRNVTIGTTSLEFADDAETPTLIDPASDLGKQAAALRVGQIVTFDGTFVSGKDDGIGETSVTQEGAMTEPDILMAFHHVRPYEGAGQ